VKPVPRRRSSPPPGSRTGLLRGATPTGPREGRWERSSPARSPRANSKKSEPVHGYYFKVLKGQGPAAPLGEIDFVVKGVMIGGFALVAAPAEVTG